jgi:hypothetical protein
MNWAPAVQQAFIVVGWSASLGSTWGEVENELQGASLVSANGSYFWTGSFLPPGGFLGATTVGSAISGQNLGTPALLFSSVSSLQVPVSVTTATELYATVVPEPGTLTIAGLGVAALVIVRRRK